MASLARPVALLAAGALLFAVPAIAAADSDHGYACVRDGHVLVVDPRGGSVDINPGTLYAPAPATIDALVGDRGQCPHA